MLVLERENKTRSISKLQVSSFASKPNFTGGIFSSKWHCASVCDIKINTDLKEEDNLKLKYYLQEMQWLALMFLAISQPYHVVF